MTAKEIKMRFAPTRDIIVVVTIRYRAANDQEQNLRQRMKDTPTIAWVTDRGRRSSSTERRDFPGCAATIGDMA